MKIHRAFGVLSGLIFFASPAVKAERIELSFSGVVQEVLDLSAVDFSLLLSVGDPVSGAIQFEFNPPPAFNVGNATGAYSTPPGMVLSPFASTDKAAGLTYASLTFERGIGPSAVIGPIEIMLAGLGFVMDIDGLNASLPEYLSLGVGDVSEFFLTGEVDSPGGLVFGPVANIYLTGVSFSIVPDWGSTGMLLGIAGAALAALSLRRSLCVSA